MARRDWYCEDVLSGNLEIKKVWEDERVMAFHHPQPQAEIHGESMLGGSMSKLARSIT